MPNLPIGTDGADHRNQRLGLVQHDRAIAARIVLQVIAVVLDGDAGTQRGGQFLRGLFAQFRWPRRRRRKRVAAAKPPAHRMPAPVPAWPGPSGRRPGPARPSISNTRAARPRSDTRIVSVWSAQPMVSTGAIPDASQEIRRRRIGARQSRAVALRIGLQDRQQSRRQGLAVQLEAGRIERDAGLDQNLELAVRPAGTGHRHRNVGTVGSVGFCRQARRFADPHIVAPDNPVLEQVCRPVPAAAPQRQPPRP